MGKVQKMVKISCFFRRLQCLVVCGLLVVGAQIVHAAHEADPIPSVKRVIVIFDRNGGTGGTPQVAIDYRSPPDPDGYDLAKCTQSGISVPTREKFEFLGYYENGVQYIDAEGNSVQNYKIKPESDYVVLTAKWLSLCPLGVTVNGEDVSLGCGLGWKTDPLVAGYFDLTGGVDYVVSGTNLDGKVMLAVTGNSTLTISNLNLKCTTTNECCLWATSNVTVKVLLAGENTLDASTMRAEAVCIENGSTLTIDKAPGLTDEQAKLTAKGGSRGAAIGVGVRSTLPGSALYIDGGTIVARGGAGAAGIGGSYTDAHREGSLKSDIHIRGGHVAAYGGEGLEVASGYTAYGSGAGIGSAAFNYFARTDIHISGGYVEAQGGRDAAGIGSGCDSQSGDVTVSGGTVIATRGERYNDTNFRRGEGLFGQLKATDMKNGWYGNSGNNVGELTICGGSVMMTHVVAGEEAPETRPDPIDAAANRVWCVTVPGIAADGAVAVFGLEDYGTKDIVAIEGKAYLWLPNGTYEFIADGFTYAATVNGAHVTAEKVGPAQPWIAYVDADGTEKYCKDYVVVTNETATFEDGRWYAVTGTVSRAQIEVNGAAHLILCDGASLTADANLNNYAGIRVKKGNALSIYGQSMGTGQLTAKGQWGGSGIGANNGGDPSGSGTVIINGGTVKATGDMSGAGIGGGDGNSNGTVIINGGTVTAIGGKNGAAGIGGGQYYGSGGIVTINGGTVTATGGNGAAGIGGGDSHMYPREIKGEGPAFTINGGTVTATGGDGAPAIGPGRDGTAPGSVTFGDGCAWLVKAGTSASSATEVAAGDYAETHAQVYVHIEATEERQGVQIVSIAIKTEEGQSQFEATFASTKDAWYSLLRSEDLTTPVDQWKVIVTEQAPGENFMLADPNPPAEKAFYTVVTGAVGK